MEGINKARQNKKKQDALLILRVLPYFNSGSIKNVLRLPGLSPELIQPTGQMYRLHHRCYNLPNR